jgi:small-conductance mechanosensitive channel
VVWLLEGWNVQVPYIAKVANSAFDISVTLILALLFWRWLNRLIARKLAETAPDPTVNEKKGDDEWGSVALDRSHTLLPMVRKAVGMVMLVMVTLIILSELGVNIGPLLAGAGVIGLAVGFGAQKLVADILSGFFFLLDDAFRVGEYIQAGSVSGSVEAITLRNAMLRHHRGMLQIVPFSELGSITNYMRGGMVVKFNIELPYDTDIEKVRKIIKKVGKKMLQDPELGPDFIAPVKSQGVRSVGDSVMTFRVKFTAKPGKHFVIRREAFRRITEALEAKGIFYAHRKVIVELPAPDAAAPGLDSPLEPTRPGDPPPAGHDTLLAGAAAGLETMINKEGVEDPSPKTK